MKREVLPKSKQFQRTIQKQPSDLNPHLYQGMCSKQGPTLREFCLHFRLRSFRSGTDLKYKQRSMLDKSGHGCGRFNEIKANRITTHRYV